MSETIDYRAVEVPEDKDPTEYSWQQRRAEILSLVEQAGHPDAVHKSRLAERYGTSPSNITKDFQRLQEYYQENLGGGAKTITQVVYKKAVREYVDRGEYDKAVRCLESWNDWLFDVGAQQREPDRVQHSAGILDDVPDHLENVVDEVF